VSKQYYGVKNVDGIIYYLRHVQDDVYLWTVLKSKAHKFSTEEATETAKQYETVEFVDVEEEVSVEEKNILNGKELDFVRVNESKKEMVIYCKDGTMYSFKNLFIKVEGQDE
jgi:hypothetical protein